MTLELIACQWIIDGFKNKAPLLFLAGATLYLT